MLSRSVAVSLLASVVAKVVATDDSGKQYTGQWFVTHGKCQEDAKGCISSPGFPKPYPGGEPCTIKVEDNFNGLDTIQFDTEKNIDTLVVDGKAYSGSMKPIIKPKMNNDGTGTLIFRSDSADVRDGFKICPIKKGGRMWEVSSGLCELDPKTHCITAPNGLKNKKYGNEQTCQIDIPQGFGAIETKYLDLEVGDTLTGEKVYTAGSPLKHYPHKGEIHWVPDKSTSGEGWKLCPIDLYNYVPRKRDQPNQQAPAHGTAIRGRPVVVPAAQSLGACKGCESMPLSVRLASKDPHIGAATGFYTVDDAPETAVSFHQNPAALTVAAAGCAAASAFASLAWVMARRKQTQDPLTVSQSEPTSVA